MFTSTLRASKKSASAHDWSVILNPIRSEIVKNDTVQKIVEVFPITSAEAEELVERTPLILLEYLSEEDAHRVREHFVKSNIDLLVSNDITLRKRCYRTVWPEQPSLDFIKQETPKAGTSEKESPRAGDSYRGINQASTLNHSTRSIEDYEYFKPAPRRQADKVESPLRTPIDSAVREPARSIESSRVPLVERDSIIDELKDKLLSSQKKLTELEQKNKNLEESLAKIENEKADEIALGNYESQRQSFDSLSFEYEKKQVLLEEKIEQLSGERDRLVDELSRFRSRVSEIESEKNRLSGEQENLVKRLAFREQELDEIKAVVGRQQRLEDENKQLRARSEELAGESEERYRRYRMAEDEKRAGQMRLAQLEDEQERIRKERDEELSRFREELEALRKRAKDYELIKAENKNLQEELRVTKERLKEFTINREQQEAVAKRLRLQNELIEKEARLKELVKKQEIVEREIVERGQVIQQVLAEQEEIEREIVRAKQAQKYLTEQIKAREKPHLRTRGRLEVKSPEALSETADEI